MHIEILNLYLTQAEVNGALLILQQRTSMRAALAQSLELKSDKEKEALVRGVFSTICMQSNLEATILLHKEIEVHLNTEKTVKLSKGILSWEKWMLEMLYDKLGEVLKRSIPKTK